jgi:hypothetical protein
VLGKFTDSDEIKPILQKYFVLAHLELGKAKASNPGAGIYLSQVGGDEKGAPFFAFVEPDGKMIVNSCRNVSDNIGYPAEPHEIDWFMVMLKKAAPQMTREEAAVIEKKLRDYKRK